MTGRKTWDFVENPNEPDRGKALPLWVVDPDRFLGLIRGQLVLLEKRIQLEVYREKAEQVLEFVEREIEAIDQDLQAVNEKAEI